jgi:hypothetical protein
MSERIENASTPAAKPGKFGPLVEDARAMEAELPDGSVQVIKVVSRSLPLAEGKKDVHEVQGK